MSIMGSKRDITTTASPLTLADYPVRYGIRLKADHANSTAIIYVGNNANVTAGTSPGTDGWPLALDQEVYFPKGVMPSTGTIYLVASTGTLVAYWFLDTEADAITIGADTSDPSSSQLVPVIF